MAPYNYAGEEFLSVNLPDYETERIVLVVKLILAFVVWLVVLPVMMVSPSPSAPNKKNKEEEENDDGGRTVVVTTTQSKNNNKKMSSKTTTTKVVQHTKRGKKEKNGKSNKGSKVTVSSETPKESSPAKGSQENEQPEEATVTEVSELANILCIFGFLVTICYMMVVSSPDNSYTTRGVFEAPLFTRDECRFLIDMAETVAQRNYEAALLQEKEEEEVSQSSSNSSSSTKHKEYMMMEPIGWQKKRHQIYSTTDLNVITDPFSKEDRQWIKDKLDARLAPTIERLYGVPQGSIRANDIFVIRYDGDRQASLVPHTDDGDVTFSALLSEDFTGGGTNYYDRYNHYYHKGKEGTYSPKQTEVFAHVLPEIGQMTLFRSPILHEGVQVKKGRRYLLIGFLNVDNVDPWTNQPTGLSWFASWFSLNWASVRFKTGYSSALYSNAKREEQKGSSDWMLAAADDDDDKEESDWMSESPYIRGLFIQFHIHLTTLADLMSTHFFQSIIPADQTEPYLQKMDEAHAAARRRPSNKKLASWFSGQQVELSIGGSFHAEWSTRTRNSAKFDEEKI